ncbi:hypothetical protein SEA_FRANCOIS_4 [Gordonia phage Francois]|nr:hypothetical protein SEA_FRANCOIS_4 [Gordonia phage Francois]
MTATVSHTLSLTASTNFVGVAVDELRFGRRVLYVAGSHEAVRCAVDDIADALPGESVARVSRAAGRGRIDMVNRGCAVFYVVGQNGGRGVHVDTLILDGVDVDDEPLMMAALFSLNAAERALIVGSHADITGLRERLWPTTTR